MSTEPNSERPTAQKPIVAEQSQLLERKIVATAEGSTAEESGTESPISESTTSRSKGASFKGLMFALAAGALAWLVVQATYPVFDMPPELINLGPSASAEQELAQAAARGKTYRQHAILYTAILGALIGIALSLAESAKDQSRKAAIIGGIVVLFAGLLFGAAGALFGDMAYVSVRSPAQPLSLLGTALVQVVVLGTLGFGIGLGLAISRERLRRATLNLAFAGLLAGLCAGVCYPLVVGLLLPAAQTESTLPTERLTHLLWIAMSASMLGIVVPLTIESAVPKATSDAGATLV